MAKTAGVVVIGNEISVREGGRHELVLTCARNSATLGVDVRRIVVVTG